MLFLRLQKLSEELGFIDDPRGWPDSHEKRQEAARSRRVVGETGYFDALTGQAIQNEQDLHALLGRQNNPETIDLIGRAKTGELLLGAFKDTVEVYFTTWSKTLDPHYENFDESVRIIKSLVIDVCRAFWAGRTLVLSKTNPSANKELPWFDQFPLRDVDAELEGEADRWIKWAREVDLRRAEAAAESLSSEATATAAAAVTEVLSAKSADKPKPRRRKSSHEPKKAPPATKSPHQAAGETPEQRSKQRHAGLDPIVEALGWSYSHLFKEAGILGGRGSRYINGVTKKMSSHNRKAVNDTITNGLRDAVTNGHLTEDRVTELSFRRIPD
jgi:hypothetical protein